MKRKQRKSLGPMLFSAAMLLLCGCAGEVSEESSLPEETATAESPEEENDTTSSKEQTTQAETTAATTTKREAPAELILQNVPHDYQKTGFPTGCESYAAVGLMEYYGVSVSIDSFLSEDILPRADYPQSRDGKIVGESPWEYFIGDPARDDAFGCFAPVIETAVNRIVPNAAKALRNVPLATLCEDYIAQGDPVILWATMGMREAKEGKSWQLPNGEMFTFLQPEHALIFIGYDEEQYYFSDSLRTEEVTGYQREAVEQAYNAMGMQIVTISREIMEQSPLYHADNAETSETTEISESSANAAEWE